jgi:small subunit ribosomal protein S8
VIRNIFRVSKPGRRVFLSTKALWKPKTTTGIFILSTPKGLYTDRDARFFNLGGEILCGVY